MAKKKVRYQAIEYGSGFAVLDTETGRERWISDGVDLLFTETGKPISPGSKDFLKKLEKSLNADPDETGEAYFNDSH